jgi:aspartate racemase
MACRSPDLPTLRSMKGPTLKTVGLLGGMSWESTVSYYKILNREVGRRLGGLHSARVLLSSVDFQEIATLQHRNRWDELGQLLARESQVLEAAGSHFLVLCTNTMHMVAPAIEAAVDIPLLHIADAAASRIGGAGMDRVGLLGTRFTMEEPFYRARLEERHGIRVLVPQPRDRVEVHRVIYEELVLGRVREESRTAFAHIVADLVREGAQGVILGCTEIGLLLRQEDTPVLLFDTATIHAEEAVAVALGDD